MNDENTLIKKAKKGEAEAFGGLYDIYLTPIYRFVFLRVRNKPEAEDITQQVFLKAWQNMPKYEKRDNVPFSSWLYKIAKNTVIDYFRTAKEHVDIDVVAETIPLATTDVEGGKIDDSLKIQLVKGSLNQLTDDEQSVIIMKFVDEFSNGEIAEVLEKNEGAVRVVQHRALRKLKKIIDAQGPY